MITWREEQKAWHYAELELYREARRYHEYIMQCQEDTRRTQQRLDDEQRELARQCDLEYQWHHLEPLGESCGAAMNITRLLRASI